MTRKIQAQIGCIRIGEGCPIAVQTMCNTHTFNVEDTVAQCRAMAAAGADIIRITVPGLRDVPHMKSIREILRSEGIMTPLVADIHFSSETAIAVAPYVEKVRINPGISTRTSKRPQDSSQNCSMYAGKTALPSGLASITALSETE